MRFRVENLGPLREAEVDLSKRLIVLTGPNNTGKTYFATAVYGLSRIDDSRDISDFESLAQRAVATGRFTVTADDLKPHVEWFWREMAQTLVGELAECFGAPDAAFRGSRVIVSLDDDAVRQALGRVTEAGRSYGKFGIARRRAPGRDAFDFALSSEDAVDNLPRRLPWSEKEWDSLPSPSAEELRKDAIDDVSNALSILLRRMTTWTWRRTTMFPAERIAINLFAREIAAARMQLANDLLSAKGTDRVPQRLAWPIRDAVQAALRLPDDAKRVTDFADLAADLERDVLGGVVSVSPYGAAMFTPHHQTSALDVQQSASVVKSLASIVFYFRHQAQEGDFLLIDEPELNLHPDNQRKVARFLARAVNRGFRILISTHSDYVLRELNQLLQLGRPDERAKKLVQELGYPEDALLQPADIGVYLFQGGTAKEVEVSEEGFEVKTIEDEIAELNVLQQKIYSAFLD